MEEISLEDLRQDIDGIDDQLTALFARRMELAAQVARVKQRGSGPVLQRGREEAILARLAAQADPRWQPALRQLYATIFGLSRAHQRALLADAATPLRTELAAANARGAQGLPQEATVACQGITGAYSHLAAGRLFRTPQVVFLRSFEAVFRAVERGLCPYGVLPIENSSFGSVTRVYDLLKLHDCRIVRSLRMPIDHCLLSQATSLKQVREIFSHEQAFGQCSGFLAAHSNITVTVCENTAVAARMAAQAGREDTAAISSEECAALYGLHILRKRLQNEEHNETRFICIAPQAIITPGANRCSVLLSLPHHSGSLSALLQLPACLGVNLTKLETRPVPGKEFEFLFYLDFEVDASQPAAADFLEQMQELSEEFTFLGSYKEELPGADG
ncbi:MAG: chorismate mutase [Oscillospiraceae bacterium]|jgi:chorismate mutase/prephenate dehydratase|nr:chorismate mutase [Oscillospiraceae bacterium]